MGKPEVVIKMQAYKEVAVFKNGKPAKKRIPGDTFEDDEVVFYVIDVRNKGTGTATNVVVKDDIPHNAEYVEGSAVGKRSVISLSIDNGGSFTEQSMMSDDSSVKITNIQWRLENMPAKSSRRLEFQVRAQAKKAIIQSFLAAYLWLISSLRT